MGYQVYEQPRLNRWAGYGVPAVCDWPGCDRPITRGTAYACDDQEHDCGLFMCFDHPAFLVDHDEVEAKPDTAEWLSHILADESWGQWRAENPERVESMRSLIAEEES